MALVPYKSVLHSTTVHPTPHSNKSLGPYSSSFPHSDAANPTAWQSPLPAATTNPLFHLPLQGFSRATKPSIDLPSSDPAPPASSYIVDHDIEELSFERASTPMGPNASFVAMGTDSGRKDLIRYVEKMSNRATIRGWKDERWTDLATAVKRQLSEYSDSLKTCPDGGNQSMHRTQLQNEIAVKMLELELRDNAQVPYSQTYIDDSIKAEEETNFARSRACFQEELDRIGGQKSWAREGLVALQDLEGHDRLDSWTRRRLQLTAINRHRLIAYHHQTPESMRTSVENMRKSDATSGTNWRQSKHAWEAFCSSCTQATCKRDQALGGKVATGSNSGQRNGACRNLSRSCRTDGYPFVSLKGPKMRENMSSQKFPARIEDEIRETSLCSRSTTPPSNVLDISEFNDNSGENHRTDRLPDDSAVPPLGEVRISMNETPSSFGNQDTLQSRAQDTDRVTELARSGFGSSTGALDFIPGLGPVLGTVLDGLTGEPVELLKQVSGAMTTYFPGVFDEASDSRGHR